ncbi:MAG: hypothetical protein HKO65_05065 [Gemmatimonadetes bacterium]|nr:hypothetical protein [Gemmatimonadota bacterium]NNM04453.1 hypothetical protein [Gemmatimonadota bacterium]
MRLFFFGALLGLIGIGTESGLLVFAAIAALLLGALLRFLPRRNGETTDQEEGHEDRTREREGE